MTYKNDISKPNLIFPMVRLLYLRDYITHSRVLILDCKDSLADFMLDARARSVCVACENEFQTPAARNMPGVDIEIMDYDNLSFPDGAFDFAIVPSFSSLKNKNGVLKELKRVTGRRGNVAVFCPNSTCENPIEPRENEEITDYYDFYEILASEFDSVQMIAQAPFSGYAVTDLGNESSDLEISLDAELMNEQSEDIEWFIAICSNRPVRLDPYSIIQIPHKHLLKHGDSGQISQIKLELGNRGVKIESLEKDLENERLDSESARERAVKLAKELSDLKKSIQQKELAEQYETRNSKIELSEKTKGLETELRVARQRAVSAEDSRDEMIDRVRQLVKEADSLREDLEKREDQSSQIKKIEEQFNSRLENYRRISEEANLRVQAADNNLDSVKTQLKDTMAKLKSSDDSLEKLSEEKISYETEIQKERRKNIELISKLDKRDKKIIDIESKAALLLEKEKQNNEPDKRYALEIVALENKLFESAGKIIKLESELARLSALVRDLTVKLKSAFQNKDNNSLNNAEFKKRIDRLKMELAAEKGARRGNWQAKVEAQLQLATLETKLRQKSNKNLISADTIDKKNDAEFSNKMIHAKLEGELQAARWKFKELEAVILDFKRQKTDMEKNLARIESQNKELTIEKDNIKDEQNPEVAALEQELSQKKVLADELSRKLFEKNRMENIREDEADFLKTRLKKLEKKIVHLNETEKKLKDNEAQAIANNERLETNLGTLKTRLQDEKNKAGQLQALYDSALKDKDSPKKELEELVRKNENAKDRIQTLEAAILENNKKQLLHDENQKIKVKNLESEIRILKDAVENAEIKSKHNKEIINDLTSKLERYKLAAEDMNGRLEQFKAQTENEKRCSQMAGADAARLFGQIDNLKKEVTNLEHETKALGMERDAGEKSLATLRSSLKNAEKKLKITQINKEIDGNNVECQKLEEKIAALQNELGNSKSELLSVGEKLAAVEEINKSIVSEKQKSDAVVSDIKNAKMELKENLAKYKKENEDLLRQIEKVDENKSKIILDLKIASKNLNQTLNENKILKGKFDSSKSELDNSRIKISTLEKTSRQSELLVESLTEQLEERDIRATKLEKDISTLKEKVKDHSSEVSAWDMELKFRAARIEKLESNEIKRKSMAPPLPSVYEEELRNLKLRVSELNDSLGEKDAQLLLLHNSLGVEKSKIKNVLSEFIAWSNKANIDNVTRQNFENIISKFLSLTK